MNKPVAHILKDLKLDEISLCEFPASPGAHVAIFKAQANPIKGQPYDRVAKALAEVAPAAATEAFNAAISKAGEMTAKMFSDALKAEDAQRQTYYLMQNVNQGIYALGDSLRSIYADDTVTDKASAVEKTTTEFLGWIKTAISPDAIDAAVNGDGDDGDDETTNDPDGVAKMAKNMAKTDADPDGTGAVKWKSKITKDDVGKDHPDGGTVAWGDSGMTVAKSVPVGPDEVVVKKSDMDNLIGEAVKKAMNDPEGETFKLRETVRKMGEEREHTVLVAKASKLVDGVPHVTVEQAVTVMKALSASPEALAAYEATLNSARIAKSLAPIGADGSTSMVGGTAIDRMEQATDAVIADHAKISKSISRQTAQAMAIAANPALYNDYKAERRAAN